MRTGEQKTQAPIGHDGLFVFVGFTPNTHLVASRHVEHDAAGYFVTNSRMETSAPGLFAVGDVRAQLVRQITTAVGDATTAAIAVERYITELKQQRAVAGVSAELDANAEAQARALAFGTDDPALPAHRRYPGNRPSSTLRLEWLDARHLGGLLAAYEHKVFTQGVLWNVNSFDQWGVELGKQLAGEILANQGRA